MEKYFDKWKLAERVTSLHQRFTESVLNTALYSGHLEKNRQNTLNALLASIAFLSLAQVSRPISVVLGKVAIVITEEQLNQTFVAAAFLLLICGGWRYILRPWVSIAFDNIKRAYLTWRTTKSIVKRDS